MTRRVLIVDDEPDIRLLIRINLVAAGYEVLEAGNGREAIDFLEGQEPDLVLLDLRLPELDGWEVLEHLKERGVAERVPVIAISAHASPTTKERAREVGFKSYVSKPFTPEELLEVVAQYAPLP
ncbi:MAG: response regulator [Actinomycetota bacterium]